MQDLTEPVLAYAKRLELDNTIPTNKIASLFIPVFFILSFSNILKNNPQYFNKNKVRKSSRKQSAKSKVISLIKLLKDDDPRISLLLSDVAEPIHIVK